MQMVLKHKQMAKMRPPVPTYCSRQATAEEYYTIILHSSSANAMQRVILGIMI